MPPRTRVNYYFVQCLAVFRFPDEISRLIGISQDRFNLSSDRDMVVESYAPNITPIIQYPVLMI